ncbi:MAG: hypothetical protein JWO36_5742 [Myxococcales bacterium]|nr:hypothetical protein [Myxococcales bacterium]
MDVASSLITAAIGVALILMNRKIAALVVRNAERYRHSKNPRFERIYAWALVVGGLILIVSAYTGYYGTFRS